MKQTKIASSILGKGDDLTRLNALSDGLFATVLTLLVLDLKVPDLINSSQGSSIGSFLQEIGPHFFSYSLTFLVAGTFWRGNLRDFNFVIRYDRRLVGYNLGFLLFIGLLPFSTAAISNSQISSNLYPFFWAIYAGNIMLAGFMASLTWNYAVAYSLVEPDIETQYVRYLTIRHIAVPIIFLLSIVAEYLFPHLVLGPYLLISIPVVLYFIDRSIKTDETEDKTQKSVHGQFLWRLGSYAPWVIIFGLAIWVLFH